MLLRELYTSPKDSVEVENPHSGVTHKVTKLQAIELVKKGWKIVQIHHEEDDFDEAMVPKDPNSVEVRVGNDINDILNGALVGKDMSDQINALSQKWLGGNEIEDDSEIHDAIRLVVYTHKGVPADQAEASEEALSIIDNLEDLDEGPTWARSGKKVVRKYRCSGGPRKNRIVSKLAQCFAPPNIKKRMQMKRMKARLGSRIIRKAKKTKRMNPASIRVQRLNKASRR
jgi:hypothetical protein